MDLMRYNNKNYFLMGLKGKTKFPCFFRRRGVSSHFHKTCSNSSSLQLSLAIPSSPAPPECPCTGPGASYSSTGFVQMCRTPSSKCAKPLNLWNQKVKVIYKSNFRSQRNNARQNGELMHLLFLYIHWVRCNLLLTKTNLKYCFFFV